MLQRVLEPEVMDTAEEACGYDSMDHSAVNRQFVIDFRRVWDSSTPILDVGTGTAQIPIELCRQHPMDDFTITAIDLADHMLALAQINLQRAKLTNRITVEKADAKRFAFPDEHFGAIISNSIIHHIPEPFACFQEMHRVCAKKGTLFIRDLLRPKSEAELDHIVNTYAADANDHQRKMFGDSLRAALTLAEVRELVARLGYPPEAIQQTTDRHWTFTSNRL